MFNEAFWFFYLIDLFGALTVAFMIVGITLFGFSLIWLGIAHDYPRSEEGMKASRKGFKICVPIAFVLGLLAIAMPSKEAMLAGGGLYVAQEIEVTDTLMKLKTVVDARIEELMPNEKATTETTGDTP